MGLFACTLEIQGAFLNGQLYQGEKLYVEVLRVVRMVFCIDKRRSERKGNIVLQLKPTLYGLEHAALALEQMKYQRKKQIHKCTIGVTTRV